MAKFALFSGVELTASKFGLVPEELAGWVQQLDFSSLKLLAELRGLVQRIACRKGLHTAAVELGISECLLEEFMKRDGQDVQFLQTSSCATQTPIILPMKRAKASADTQTGEIVPPAPIIIKEYSPAEIIKSVRELQKYPSLDAASTAMSIPAATLLAWRIQIKTCLFQTPHVEELYNSSGSKQQDSFYAALDQALFKTWGANYKVGMDVDEFLLEKVRKIAKVDAAEPSISPAWLTHFKAYYNIQ